MQAATDVGVFTLALLQLGGLTYGTLLHASATQAPSPHLLAPASHEGVQELEDHILQVNQVHAAQLVALQPRCATAAAQSQPCWPAVAAQSQTTLPQWTANSPGSCLRLRAQDASALACRSSAVRLLQFRLRLGLLTAANCC